MKTPHLAHFLQGWPLPNSIDLFLINMDPLSTYYILEEQQLSVKKLHFFKLTYNLLPNKTFSTSCT